MMYSILYWSAYHPWPVFFFWKVGNWKTSNNKENNRIRRYPWFLKCNQRLELGIVVTSTPYLYDKQTTKAISDSVRNPEVFTILAENVWKSVWLRDTCLIWWWERMRYWVDVTSYLVPSLLLFCIRGQNPLKRLIFCHFEFKKDQSKDWELTISLTLRWFVVFGCQSSG